MSTGGRVATAVAAGYLLGRTKKLKLAIAVGSMMAGKRIATNPRGLARQANELVQSNDQLSQLSDEVRDKLLSAARGAAVSVASSRLDSFSDSLHDRSEAWRSGTVEDAEDAEAGESEESEEPEEPQTVDDEPDEEESEPSDAEPEKQPAKKQPAKKSAKKSAKKTTTSAKRTTNKTAKSKSSNGTSTSKKTSGRRSTRSGSRS